MATGEFLEKLLRGKMELKKCNKCFIEKPISDFYLSKNGLFGVRGKCKDCEKNYGKEYGKKYYKEHRKERLIYRKEYYTNNLERIKKADKLYRKNNPEKVKEKYRKAEQNRKPNLIRKLNKRMSRLIRYYLKEGKGGKTIDSVLGYTIYDLRAHLEKLFKPGMTWENMEKRHIDHIIPVSWWKFETYNDREFKQCWALCNLQPLWAFDNISKSNRRI